MQIPPIVRLFFNETSAAFLVKAAIIPALALFLFAGPLHAQVQFIGQGFFPAPMEFKEIKSVQAEKDLKENVDLARIEFGPAFLEAGLRRFGERTYALTDAGNLSVAIYTFGDSRAAYSALTLLAKVGIQTGPPGDFFAADGPSLFFAAGSNCVHIRSQVSGDLPKRIAASIVNRIGSHETKTPSLIRHLPPNSCDPASIRYFLGPRALDLFGTRVAGETLAVPADVEVAQARCTVEDRTGTYSLLSFPTIQMAAEYFNSASLYDRGSAGNASLYTRQTGPLVGILEGNFPAQLADKTLGSLSFSYAVKWIYEKNKRGQTIWGVPVRILGTVVRSIVFTALLCVLSIIAGIALAAGRVYARKRWTRLAENDEYIRLKLE